MSGPALIINHRQKPEAYFSKEKARFILIDDDPITCFLWTKIIGRTFEDFNLFTFTNPYKGVEFLEDCNVAKPEKTVLFLDIHMPLLNGWEVLKRIENFNDDIKRHLIIFILSSSIDPSDTQRARNNPLVTTYFQKPLEEENLEKVMELMKLMVW